MIRSFSKIACPILLTAVLAMSLQAASAATLIYAVGASNTNGRGVAKSQAWPAVLQSMLRANGHDAIVLVNAVNGSTTSQIRARLPGVLLRSPKIVVIAAPLNNDRKVGTNTASNISAMRTMVTQRGAKVIIIDKPHRWAKRQMQADRVHFTPAGHRTLAAALYPKVVAALR